MIIPEEKQTSDQSIGRDRGTNERSINRPREVERQMDALDNVSGRNCPGTNTDEPSRAMNVYGSEMRDAHRDEMSEAWTLPGDTS